MWAEPALASQLLQFEHHVRPTRSRRPGRQAVSLGMCLERGRRSCKQGSSWTPKAPSYKLTFGEVMPMSTAALLGFCIADVVLGDSKCCLRQVNVSAGLPISKRRTESTLHLCLSQYSSSNFCQGIDDGWRISLRTECVDFVPRRDANS